MLRGLRHDQLQERLVIFRVKSAFNALIEQAPREILNDPKDLVAFALTTGGDLRLLAAARPRVTQGAPLRKAGLIFKQDQAFATLGGLDHGVGHFRPLSITRQRHWLAYHFIAMRHEGLCQVF